MSTPSALKIVTAPITDLKPRSLVLTNSGVLPLGFVAQGDGTVVVKWSSPLDPDNPNETLPVKNGAQYPGQADTIISSDVDLLFYFGDSGAGSVHIGGGLSTGGGSGGDASAANQVLALNALDSLYDALALVGTEATSVQIRDAVTGLGNGATLADLASALTPLATETTVAQIRDALANVSTELTSQSILAALGPLATSLDVQAVQTAIADLGDGSSIDDIVTALTPLATAAKQDDILTALQAQGIDVASIKSSIDLLVPDLDAVRIAVEATNTKIPASPAQDRTTAAAPSATRASNGTSFIDLALDATVTLVKTAVEAVRDRLPSTLGGKTSANSLSVTMATDQTALPSSNAAASQADGHSVTIGATSDTSSANTVIGRLQNLLSRIPAALVGGRLDVNSGAWFGSTAPTVGQKTMANSIPVAVASDNGLATSAKQPAIGTAGSPSADVVTVQGISGGTSLPVTSTSAATELAPSHVRLSSEDGFGRSIFVEPTPVLQSTFANGVTFDLWRTYVTGTGTATSTAQTDSLATVSTGATGSSIAELVSSDTFSYRAGQSLQPEFTGLFSAPASGGFQVVGVGSNDGFAVGYNGTAFGFLIRRGGVPEIRTITITTASTTNQNVTVALNSVNTSVAVTNSGNTVTTAREIAAGDYSASGLGWDAYQLGSTVIFIARQPGPLSGTYSLTATTAVGSFAQTIAGVTPSDTWYAKTAWTKDRLDGLTGANNLSGATLDPTKLSVWKVIIPYLGAGPITLQWQDPTTKRWTTCHEVAPANTATTPTVRNPVFRLWIRASGASNISCSSASMGLFCDGKVESNGQQINVPPSFKATVGNASELPLVSVRTERTYNGAENRYPFRFIELTTSANATGQVILRAYLNAALTGANFGAVNAFGHPLSYDTSATAATGGLPVGALITSPNGGSTPIDLTKLNYSLQPGDVVTFTAQQTTGTNATVAIALTGKLDSGSGGI